MANIKLKADSSFVDLDQLSTRNLLINGNFDYWQRGTSFTSFTAQTYTADRLNARSGGTVSISVTQQSDTEYPRYKFRVLAASTASDIVQTCQQIEYDVFRKYLGKPVTFTIRAKAMFANAASTAQYFFVWYVTGGTIDANCKYGAAGSSMYLAQTITTSMANYSYTFTIPSNTTSLAVGFGNGGAQSFTNGVDGFEMSWMALTPGLLAIDRPVLAGNSIVEELTLCQRYFEKSYRQSDVPGTITSNGIFAILAGAAGTGNMGGTVFFKVQKRNNSYTQYWWDPNGTPNTCYKGGISKPMTSPAFCEHSTFVRSNDATNANEFNIHWAIDNEL